MWPIANTYGAFIYILSTGTNRTLRLGANSGAEVGVESVSNRKLGEWVGKFKMAVLNECGLLSRQKACVRLMNGR